MSDTTIHDLLSILVRVENKIDRLMGVIGPKDIASDKTLDGTYGNPVIKARDPKDWKGEPMRGRKFAECPPEYLDLYAERCDFFASKEDAEGAKDSKGEPKSKWSRRDASLARGWARRIRAGHVPPPSDDRPTDEAFGADVQDSFGDVVPF